MFEPGSDAYVVTPSDAAPLPVPARFLKVGATGGNLTFRAYRGSTPVTIVTVANEYIWCNVYQVLATGTAATPIVAFV